ncbi:MAG: DUF2807 domain-containing protein [Deltaproteobacteria bacterium]|nr:DUF2807 domain-containing protein [Deltaproteobacteria bacterium]
MRAVSILLAVVVLSSGVLPVHAQEAPPAAEAEALVDGDDGGQGAGLIARGMMQLGCGLGLGTAACLLPVVGTVAAAALWNRHEFSGLGASVILPGPGRLDSPRFNVMGARFEGLFALAALTAVPTLAVALLGTVLAVGGTAALGRGIGNVVDTWVGKEIPESAWKTETRSTGGFRRVRVEGGAFKVVVRQGDRTEVRVRAPAEYLGRVSTLVTDDTLVVNSSWRFRIRQHAEIEVTTPSLESVELAGVGHLQVQGATGDALRVVVSGAGKTEVDARVRSLTVEIHGAGVADITGRVQEVHASVTGTGALNAGELETQDAYVAVSGAGSATVKPGSLLDASISGVGKIRYRGEPRTIRKDVDGLGSVQQEGPARPDG